jgi:hypothetical protein
VATSLVEFNPEGKIIGLEAFSDVSADEAFAAAAEERFLKEGLGGTRLEVMRTRRFHPLNAMNLSKYRSQSGSYLLSTSM